jgi:hypothetical protein
MAGHFNFRDMAGATTFDPKDVLVSRYQTGGSAGDDASSDFMTEGGETQMALLLPAVQQAREAARRTTCAVEEKDAWFDGGLDGADWL